MYTMSNDGKERMTVHVPLRLTSEEMAMLREVAKYRRFNSMHDYLTALLRDQVNEVTKTYLEETSEEE